MNLIVISGLPGTGKSLPAEDKPLRYVGFELLSVLAECQRMLNQSMILDNFAGTQSIRDKCAQLADQYEEDWRVIECICSDEELHRLRLSERQRGIPDWHELEWSDVEKVKKHYLPWEGERLGLDKVKPFAKTFPKPGHL